ncbi:MULTISPECIES: hypothetical protein [unclassified Sphingopyxis]|jgi:hypothetical protein|uniref:hypothetical protein n=1 Tax=unclassified Sphingopyxis TaxID=2614943 RepID=UPI0012E3BE74|nr:MULTISPECIES: hypothetical protein [unclassified Sphingopyxis]
MGGINIYCGSFQGEDKSGSAFEDVLDDLSILADANTLSVISRIKLSLEDASDHILVFPDDASDLIEPLRAYNATSTTLEMERHYCSRNLLKACETAAAEGEPVALVW